jgi:hypothetical protein
MSKNLEIAAPLTFRYGQKSDKAQRIAVGAAHIVMDIAY